MNIKKIEYDKKMTYTLSSVYYVHQSVYINKEDKQCVCVFSGVCNTLSAVIHWSRVSPPHATGEGHLLSPHRGSKWRRPQEYVSNNPSSGYVSIQNRCAQWGSRPPFHMHPVAKRGGRSAGLNSPPSPPSGFEPAGLMSSHKITSEPRVRARSPSDDALLTGSSPR